MSEKRFVQMKEFNGFSDICNNREFICSVRVEYAPKLVGLLNEQQATIGQLQDLCGESDGENAKLRIENKRLQEEIRLLKPTNIEQYEQIVQLQEEIDELKKDIDIYEYEEKKHSETARKLHEDNEHLRQMIKENVFERYRESSLADLEFKAIAYDDIVKLEMSYESEPKVIVICKQGKKENVKSFCQFIPFGVYYEIKELENKKYITFSETTDKRLNEMIK